jgi:ribosomal protein S18 acetylase RimI-like enzyme
VAFRIQPLAARHERDAFDCGEPALNEYFRRYARQNHERGVGRTFVAVPDDAARVVGYYTLAAGSVDFAELPEAARRKLPRYPVPVVHLGRLAVCQSARGLGLGEALLFDAVRRTLAVADEVGVVAVEVRAKDEAVSDFYRKYGFEPMSDQPLRLYLALASARRLLAE